MDRQTLDALVKTMRGEAFSFVKEPLYTRPEMADELGAVLKQVAGDKRFAHIVQSDKPGFSGNGNGTAGDIFQKSSDKAEFKSQGATAKEVGSVFPIKSEGSLDFDCSLEATLAAHLYLSDAIGVSLSLTHPNWSSLYSPKRSDAAELAQGIQDPSVEILGQVYTWKAKGKSEDAGTVTVVEDSEGATRAQGVRTVVNTPVVTRSNEVIGSLSIHFKHCKPPSGLEVGIAELCAFHAADILDAAKSQENLLELNQNLESIVSLGKAHSRALVLELSSSEQRQRKQLAHQLHDNLQQLLVAAKMNAELFAEENNDTTGIRGVIKILDEAITCSREVVSGLSPPVLHGVDLQDSLNWLVRHMKRQHGLEVALVVDTPPSAESDVLRNLLMEIARELLFNCVKHSRVKQAVIHLGVENGFLRLEVADEGIGCEPDLLDSLDSESFGLASIRGRVHALGGSMHAWSAPDQGCRVWVLLPVGESEAVVEDDSPAGE